MAQDQHGLPSTEYSVSAVVPAYNAADTIGRCLDALRNSTRPPHEIIVACDGCTDDTALIAKSAGARVVETAGRTGAANARNAGVRAAAGNVFFFVDSDCVARPDALEAGLRAIAAGEEIAFGSYTRDTRVGGFLTRFKNLQHHHTHQSGQDYQSTFWSGCGLVTRRAFEAVGGFDGALKMCEDIEFGAQANRCGHHVRLVRDMQVEHLKRYDLPGLVRSDLFQRAVPWTRLIRSGRVGMGSLNTNRLGQGSVAATALILLCLPAALFWPPAAAIGLAVLLALIAANSSLLSLVARELGPLSSLAAIPTLLLHYFICGFGYVLGHIGPPTPTDRHGFTIDESDESETSAASHARVSP